MLRFFTLFLLFTYSSEIVIYTEICYSYMKFFIKRFVLMEPDISNEDHYLGNNEQRF